MLSNKTYKYLFFDLDRTLWDYRANSEFTLKDLLNKYAPELNARFDEFLKVYYRINEGLWLDYRDGRIKKDVLSIKRFTDSFSHFHVDSSTFAQAFAEDYIIESPKKSKLYPNTLNALKYLKNKNYQLYLLTNGFLEVQKVKIRESKIEPFFQRMITSEEAGFQKPDKRIFEYAIQEINAEKDKCIMIGDDIENDIMGAQNFGIDSVLFNPENTEYKMKATFEINDLSELKSIF